MMHVIEADGWIRLRIKYSRRGFFISGNKGFYTLDSNMPVILLRVLVSCGPFIVMKDEMTANSLCPSLSPARIRLDGSNGDFRESRRIQRLLSDRSERLASVDVLNVNH
jgi:hypothetical protein